MRRKTTMALSTLILGIAGIVWAAAGPGALSVNGKTVSTDFMEKGGRVYVPLADVAKALDMTVAKSDTGYALEPVGGANPVEGLRGKVGDTLRVPEFTFSVLKVVQSDHYAKQFGTGTVDADSGRTIVGVVCRVKNALNKTIYFNPFGQGKTALTDQDEHSYTCYTGGASDLPPGTPNLLPGAAYDFALTFQVPSGTKLKDLVYEFDSMDVRAHRILRVGLQ